MPQAPNRLFSRAEVRNMLREQYNAVAVEYREHKSDAHNPAISNPTACAGCMEYIGQMNALEEMYRYFGGRS